ncbi:hypothetical protein C8Q76DRAFT_743961 [Earliella scabrosa]|nr:hypothetical protein C8Q76DRAFT_743961 [Earliella scabrosa]
MSTARNPPATHDSAVGAMYAIVVMCCMIYGTSCCQGFFYYRSARAKEDCLALRLLVISFLLIDGFHQLAVLLVGQHYIVSHFGDHTAPYTTIPWSAPVEILTHAFTALGFNSFCTMRLWNLTRNKALSIMALTITAAAAATNMSLAIRLFIFHNLIESTRSTRVHGIVATLLSILADSAISILLSYQLYARRTGLPRSNALVMKIIIFTLTSGLLTTPFHVGKLYIYITGRHSIFVTLISFLLAKFYTSAFITT